MLVGALVTNSVRETTNSYITPGQSPLKSQENSKYAWTMPTTLRIGPFRFFFYSNEYGEPAHIHVQRDTMLAKFWLEPVSLAGATGFPPKDIRKIRLLVMKNRELLLEAWNEYFGR